MPRQEAGEPVVCVMDSNKLIILSTLQENRLCHFSELDYYLIPSSSRSTLLQVVLVVLEHENRSYYGTPQCTDHDHET